MELRFAIRVADERDHKHLASTMRLANQRNSPVLLLESTLSEADVVIVRRGESGSAPLLRACESTTRPIPVIYATSDNEHSTWILRWPARTTDLIPLAEALHRCLMCARDSHAISNPAPATPAVTNQR